MRGWRRRLHSKEDLLLNLIVEVEERVASLPPLLLKVRLQLLEPEIDATRILCRCPLWPLEHDWEEPLADRSSYLGLLASVKTALQDEQIRYRQENLSVAALDLLPKLFILLACAFNELAKAD